MFVIILHPDIDYSYLTIYDLLFNEIKIIKQKKKGVFCFESNNAEINKLQKFKYTLNLNNNKK